MEVWSRVIPEGNELMNDPSSDEVHKPDRTVRGRTRNQLRFFRQMRRRDDEPADVVQMYVFYGEFALA